MKASCLLGLALALGFGQRLGAAPGESAPPAPRTDYFIVVTGEELLRGAYPDSHTHFLTRILQPLGCHCVGSITVDDRAEDLREALRFAQGKARFVLVTGGLGPTMNDITRETLAECTGVALRESPEVAADLERRFSQPRDPLRSTLRRQALVPESGTYFPNSNGTAVGLVFEREGRSIVALPGPPRELRPMVTNELIPYLVRRFGARSPGATLTLRFAGLGQSAIDQVLRERVSLPSGVFVSSVFEGARVDFIFAAPGNLPENREQLESIRKSVRAQLGDHLYAEDDASLEAVVGAQLVARGGLLTLVEVATGGEVGRGLGTAVGAERWLAGGYEAPTEERMYGLLRTLPPEPGGGQSAEGRARALGEAALRLTGSRWGLAVGGVERTSAGAGQVWVAFGGPDRPWTTERFTWRDSTDTGRANLATQVLAWLWRQTR